MKKIEVGLFWDVDGHHMEVTKVFKNGKCQITETWIAEDTGKNCKHVETYKIGTDGDEQYAYAQDCEKYANPGGDSYEWWARKYVTGAMNWTPEMETKEEEEMADKNMVKIEQITVDGIVYTNTRPGYYYKKVDGKQTRIPKAEWEEVLGKWEQEAEAERKAREEKQAKADKEAEDKVNGKTKKTAKPRRSKDIAFATIIVVDGAEKHITLTAKQVDFIRHIPDTSFYENGLESAPWCDVLADEIGGQFAGKPMTVGAMISTLREKKLIYVQIGDNGKKAKYFGFTELGKKVAKELGLE